jgi:large subunit ribosomal protein L15
MKLNQLAPAPGSRHARKRVGRGIGSGLGKTAGRGHKGQKSRSGVSVTTFEGGQMPVYRRLPKRGFKNPFRKVHAIVNLDRLEKAIEAGRLDPGAPIGIEALEAAGLVSKRLDGVRLLARGKAERALTIHVDSASKAAVAAIEAAGGRVSFEPLETPASTVAASRPEPADTGEAAPDSDD